MSPLIPHLSSQCIEDLNLNSNQKWPEIDLKFLEVDEINFVIQINGKKKAILNTKKDVTEQELLNKIKSTSSITKFINNKKIKKSFFVKNKLLNILIDE